MDVLDRVGAVHLEAALPDTDLAHLLRWSDTIGSGRPGERINQLQCLDWLIDNGIAGSIARTANGPDARPVRAILFDKTPGNNWALGWHQDRTIAVEKRYDTPGFDNWNMKAGVCHAEPPFSLIERMVTMRIHLDDVNDDNAPLLLAPGSHRFGRIVESEIDRLVKDCGQMACRATAGDIWLYRTAVLHASKRSKSNGRRRVLQVDFSPDQLPPPLQWAA